MNYKRLTSQEIEAILKLHDLWINSGEIKGQRAIFEGLEIFDFTFDGRNLHKAKFDGSHLIKCRFNCNLAYSSFVNAEVTKCDFTGAILLDVSFFYAHLKANNFSDALDCTIPAFMRAELSGSVFPKFIKFDKPLERINSLIKQVRNLTYFTWILAFAVLTAGLFVKPHEIQLPLIKQTIDLSNPSHLILLGIFIFTSSLFASNALSQTIYFMEKMPTTLPNGIRLYDSVFPWFYLSWPKEAVYINWTSKRPNTREITRIMIHAFASCITYLSFVFIFFKLSLFFLPYSLSTIFFTILVFAFWLLAFILSYFRDGFRESSVTTLLAIVSVILFRIISSSNHLTINYALTLPCAWFLDYLVNLNASDKAGLDVSYATYKLNQNKIDENMKRFNLRWTICNVFSSLVCSLVICYFCVIELIK